ncbi:hypothetical protein HC891_13480 [Candidatus Gracilibacteria bacterium]|nr:hypothetical protein [Candidatus Gracilibacteria bacterium]
MKPIANTSVVQVPTIAASWLRRNSAKSKATPLKISSQTRPASSGMLSSGKPK